MSDLQNANAAQNALGKFYLHPWDSQVLVDWAKSLVQQGSEQEEIVRLSKMERAGREDILAQFDTATIIHDVAINMNEMAAITAYLEDLRRRVLADEIDPAAAFAQVRPLAYDLEGLQLTGLSELDEDLNLLDSGVEPFHHTDLVEANRNVFIRSFFRDMKILEPMPVHGKFGPGEDYPTDFEVDLTKRLEALALAIVVALVVLYVFLVLMGFK